LRLFSFGIYGLALAALALVVFGAIECPPMFSGLVQNVYVYRMAKFKKIWPFRFYAIKF